MRVFASMISTRSSSAFVQQGGAVHRGRPRFRLHKRLLGRPGRLRQLILNEAVVLHFVTPTVAGAALRPQLTVAPLTGFDAPYHDTKPL